MWRACLALHEALANHNTARKPQASGGIYPVKYLEALTQFIILLVLLTALVITLPLFIIGGIAWAGWAWVRGRG